MRRWILAVVVGALLLPGVAGATPSAVTSMALKRYGPLQGRVTWGPVNANIVTVTPSASYQAGGDTFTATQAGFHASTNLIDGECFQITSGVKGIVDITNLKVKILEPQNLRCSANTTPDACCTGAGTGTCVGFVEPTNGNNLSGISFDCLIVGY